MGTPFPTVDGYPYGIRPWDISEPGFTHTTKRLGTFLLYLMEEDTEHIIIEHLNPEFAILRLLGPNGNEMCYRAQRVSIQGKRAALSPRDAKTVVETIRTHPKNMPEGYRAVIAAQLAVYLDVKP